MRPASPFFAPGLVLSTTRCAAARLFAGPAAGDSVAKAPTDPPCIRSSTGVTEHKLSPRSLVYLSMARHGQVHHSYCISLWMAHPSSCNKECSYPTLKSLHR
uniref:Uncharacterized protein n=1 Tax=Aegilops tauschii subsp. strangulata TaxID=200361 RepID=A0A453CZL8_AEGTS